MKRLLSLLALVLIFSLVGCQTTPSAANTPVPTPAPDQFVFTRENFPRLDGSTATVPLGQAVASVLLGESREAVDDLIHFNKTSRAYYNLVDGSADLLLVAEGGEDSYAYRDKNEKTWRMEPIASETLVFFVNADNPVENLTLDQVREIYSGRITNWSQVGGSNAPIQAYQRPAGGGSYPIHTAYYAVMDAGTPADSPTGVLFDWLLSQEGQDLIAHEGYVSVKEPTV